jgi:hypothetical protein
MAEAGTHQFLPKKSQISRRTEVFLAQTKCREVPDQEKGRHMESPE